MPFSLIGIVQQLDAIGEEGDALLLVEGADGLLEGLLRHLQLGGDEFGRGVVSERQETVVTMECLED